MPVELQETAVSPDDLFFDPNNLRFFAIDDDELVTVDDDKITAEAVQRKARDRIARNQFDVDSIRKSILTEGYLGVDRLVVVPLPPDDSKYVVIEGNRRLAAIKLVLDQARDNAIDLPSDIRKSLERIPVVVVRDSDGDRSAMYRKARTLQGIRHLSSVKGWAPYAQAQLIPVMMKDGLKLSEIKDSLGLTQRAVKILHNVLGAMNQLREDPDVGDHFAPQLWGHFEEAFKNRKVNAWLGWDEKAQTITQDANRRLFYEWIIGFEDDDGKWHDRKIRDAKDIRDLSDVIEDPDEFRAFTGEPDLTLREAAARVVGDRAHVDWRTPLRANMKKLSAVTVLDLVDADEEDRVLVKDLIERCEQILRLIESAQEGQPPA